jgi:hypothetical protein
MTIKPHTLPVALCLMLFAGAASCAGNDIEINGAAAAAAATLEDQATTMEAAIEQECQKVAQPARPLCREQRARAVQRLRERAASLR